MKALTRILSLVCAAGLILGADRPVWGQEADFKGKQINLIIAYPPGGGTDAVGRHLGHYLRAYLPGNPTMVYRNMPAGRGTVAAEFVANKAPKDGLHWYVGAGNVLDANIIRKKEVNYEPRLFNFVGGFDRSGSIIIARKEKVANFRDLSAPPLLVGSSDGSDTWGELIMWGQHYLGWNVKFVLGYPGTSALLLAIQRGEIDAFGTSILNVTDELLVRQKDYAAIAQNGSRRNGMITARHGFESVPTIAQEMQGKLPPGIAAETFDFWIKSNSLDKWFFIAPGTPEPIIKAYRAAFDQATKDPEFLERGHKMFGADFAPQNHEEIAEMVRLISYPDERVLAFLHQMKVKSGLPTQQLTQAERDRLAAKLNIGKKVKTTLMDVKNGGRVVEFLDGTTPQTANVSSRETKVTIGGQSAERADLKAGMSCEVNYLSSGTDAIAITC